MPALAVLLSLLAVAAGRGGELELKESVGCPSAASGCPTCVNALGCYYIPAVGAHSAKCKNAVTSLRYFNTRISKLASCPAGLLLPLPTGGGGGYGSDYTELEQEYLDAFAKARLWHATKPKFAEDTKRDGLEMKNQAYVHGSVKTGKGGHIFFGAASPAAMWAAHGKKDTLQDGVLPEPEEDDAAWDWVMRVFIGKDQGDATREWWDNTAGDHDTSHILRADTDMGFPGKFPMSFYANWDIPPEDLTFGDMLDLKGEQKARIIALIASHSPRLEDMSHEELSDLHDAVFQKHPANRKQTDRLWFPEEGEKHAREW